MRKPQDKRKGMALILALVFAVVLLQMAIAYSGMTRGIKTQTVQIDERIKLDYLAHGLTELALLKFQLYPGDFYACWEAHKKGNSQYLKDFTIDADEFKTPIVTDSKSAFNDRPSSIQLASMAIFTDNKWNKEALFIQAVAGYEDQFGRSISKDAVRIVSVERITKN